MMYSRAYANNCYPGRLCAWIDFNGNRLCSRLNRVVLQAGDKRVSAHTALPTTRKCRHPLCVRRAQLLPVFSLGLKTHPQFYPSRCPKTRMRKRLTGGDLRSSLPEESSREEIPAFYFLEKKGRETFLFLAVAVYQRSFPAPRTDLSLLQKEPKLAPHNGAGFTAFLAQADTIKFLMKGLFDSLSILEFRPRLLDIRIARDVLQQCPCLFVSRLLLSFASD
jgi:hypothetical protein